jgi:hypothetical protein
VCNRDQCIRARAAHALASDTGVPAAASPPARRCRRRTQVFRATHYLYPLIFIASIAHEFVCYYYFLPGMILIMADVAQRLTNKVYPAQATLTAVGNGADGSVVVLHVQSPFPKGSRLGSAGAAELQGLFFYLNIPAVSVLYQPCVCISACRGTAVQLAVGLRLAY